LTLATPTARKLGECLRLGPLRNGNWDQVGSATLCSASPFHYFFVSASAAVDYHDSRKKGDTMEWRTPVFVEICVGLEINGYLPAVMAFTPDEKYLLTTNGVSNDMSIIDAPALKVINTIQVGQQPWGITMSDR
jgi:coenzyme PQQ precursor peptide PqqA